MKQCMDAENLHRRLKKIIGQVQAIDRMVDEDVPCEDIPVSYTHLAPGEDAFLIGLLPGLQRLGILNSGFRLTHSGASFIKHIFWFLPDHCSKMCIRDRVEVVTDGENGAEYAETGVYALLRRQGAQVDVLSYGNTCLDLTGYTLSAVGSVRLSSREFDVMRPVSYTHLDVYKRQGPGPLS